VQLLPRKKKKRFNHQKLNLEKLQKAEKAPKLQQPRSFISRPIEDKVANRKILISVIKRLLK